MSTNELTTQTPFDNVVIRRRHERRRNRNRTYRIRRVQLNVPINNEDTDTLNRIINLPRQFANDPLINNLFNGTLFI